MHAIVSAFWNIVLFRSGPQDLPDSRPLLLLAAGLYAFSDVLILVASSVGREAAADVAPPSLLSGIVLPLVVDMGLLYLCVAGVLQYTGHAHRLRRTMAAMFGAQGILQLVTWPAFLLLMFETLSEIWFVVILLLLLAVLWSIAVYAHILAQAMQRSFGTSVALATLYVFLNYQLVRLIPEL